MNLSPSTDLQGCLAAYEDWKRIKCSFPSSGSHSTIFFLSLCHTLSSCIKLCTVFVTSQIFWNAKKCKQSRFLLGLLQEEHAPCQWSLLFYLFHSQHYSPSTILNDGFDGILLWPQHFAMDCKQASNNDVPWRAGTHKVSRSLAGESSISTDYKAGDQKANECHVSVSLAPCQL